MREVTLESERDETEGHCTVVWQRTAPAHEARRQATVALAGPVAELVFLGNGVLESATTLTSWRADWDEAEAQLERLHLDVEERQRTRLAILQELHETFDGPRNYERLARIADALDAHTTLDETLFQEVLHGPTARHRGW